MSQGQDTSVANFDAALGSDPGAGSSMISQMFSSDAFTFNPLNAGADLAVMRGNSNPGSDALDFGGKFVEGWRSLLPDANGYKAQNFIEPNGDFLITAGMQKDLYAPKPNALDERVRKTADAAVFL